MGARPASGFAAQFLDMAAAERGAAANTLDAYRRDLDDYLTFLAESGASPPTADVATAREGIDDEARPWRERLRAARMSCLLETLYATGLRVSELVALPRRAAHLRD